MRFLSLPSQVAVCSIWLVVHLFGCFLGSAVARPSCPKTCGNTSIPYPFGIAPGCGLPAFQLNCSATKEGSPSSPFDGFGEEGPLFPFLLTGSGLFQVLQITPTSIIINVTDLKAVSCDGSQAIATFVLDPLSPFFLSGNNQFFVTGCNSTGDVNTDLTLGSTRSCNVSSCSNTPSDSSFCSSQQCCVALPGGSREVVMHGGGYRSGSGGCGFASIGYPPSFAITSDGSTGSEEYGLQLAYAVDGHSCSDPNFNSICAARATCLDVEHGHVCLCDGVGLVGDGYRAGSGCSGKMLLRQSADICSSVFFPRASFPHSILCPLQRPMSV